MNQDPVIQCPKCGAQIKLTDSLAGPLVAATRAEYEERLRQQDEAVAEREAMVAQKTRDLNTLVNERVQQARRAADEEARQNVEIETTKLRQDLATAQQAQAEALAAQCQLQPGSFARAVYASATAGAFALRADQALIFVKADRARRDVEFTRQFGDGVISHKLRKFNKDRGLCLKSKLSVQFT